MDWIQRIGGRKFWMALITVGVATFIELNNPQGLSSTMAAFLGSVVAAFSVANYASSAKHMDSKSNGGGTGGKMTEISEQIETLRQQVQAANDPELVSKLIDILSNTLSKMSEVENVSRQVGSGMVHLGNQVQALSKKLG